MTHKRKAKLYLRKLLLHMVETTSKIWLTNECWWLGDKASAAENNEDRDRKGRTARSEKHGRSAYRRKQEGVDANVPNRVDSPNLGGGPS